MNYSTSLEQKKVKFKSLDLVTDRVALIDKTTSTTEGIDNDSNKRIDSYHDPAVNILQDPFTLSKANSTVFFGPSHTLSPPSVSFGIVNLSFIEMFN
jgi:hypothetical protein